MDIRGKREKEWIKKRDKKTAKKISGKRKREKEN